MHFSIAVALLLIWGAISGLRAQSLGNRYRVEDLSDASKAPAPREGAGKPRLDAFAADLGLAAPDLEGVYLSAEFRTTHSGVTHFRYRQRFDGVDVYDAVYGINVDRNGRVLSRGGFLYARPEPGLQVPDWSGLYAAVRIAAQAVSAEAGAIYLPAPVDSSKASRAAANDNGVKRQAFAPGGFGEELTAERAWVAFRGKLRPAYLVAVTDPNQADHYEVFVDAVTREVLQKVNRTLYFQQPVPAAAPEALIFDRNSPQPNPAPGRRLAGPAAYVERVPAALAGDPVASPNGWVADGQTAGNNTVTGANPLGIPLLTTPEIVRAVDGHFRFPLELGPGAPSPATFPEAAVTNLFYWTNRAHDLFHRLGFDEPAGNFQTDNFNRGGVGGDPMYAYAHHGRASAIRGQTQNAFYTSRGAGDGQQSGIHMFLSFGLESLPEAFTDGSYDNEVILHEYTHGVTNRLVPALNGTFQGLSMGEAFSDYFALEFLTPEGATLDGEYAVAEYLFQRAGLGIRAFPYSTDMELNPLTYGRLGKVNSFLGIHDNGGIWMMALWEMRANLIRQFGEREGRRRANTLIIDALKLSPPAPSMIDMRDAILLADRAGFAGASQAEIWAAFAKRGLGVLAQTADETSGTPGTWRVRESYETPSNTGQLGFYQETYIGLEQLRVALSDGNLRTDTVEIALTSTSGDVETLLLTRRGSTWLGRMQAVPAAVASGNGRLEVGPYDYVEAHYVDHDTGAAPKLVQASIVGEPFPTAVAVQPTPLSFPNERPLNLRGANLTGNRFPLPFPFQFLGRTYNLVNISTNGLLSFEPSFATDPLNAEPCKDREAFRNVTGIAPLWTDARTNGTAHAGEDVYVSQSGDAITFRWVAETIPPAGLQPEPLNFAATLRDNGTIEFRYGAGNRNLGSGSATVCGAGPVVGLSNGMQTLDVPTVYFGRVNLENAATVMFRLPTGPTSTPQMRVETAVDGETFTGVMKIDGLVWDAGSSISRVEVLIDGRSISNAGLVARPEICQAERLPGCPVVGFTAPLNLVGLGIQPGAHTLQFRVTNAAGAVLVYPETPYQFQVEPGTGPVPVAAITRPADGAAVSGRVTVEGTAYLEGLTLTAVDLLVDGLTIGRATYGQASAAACAEVTGAPNCPRAGFNISWNTADILLPTLDGERKLSLRLTDQTGRVTLTGTLATVNIENGPDQTPPVGVLETVKNGDVLEGVVTLSGWAYDTGGRVTSATVLLNGAAVGAARLGIARPEVCAELEEAPAACPNIGFTFDLDTRRYSNGRYTLGIRLTDAGANVQVTPRLVENGINVTITNRP